MNYFHFYYNLHFSPYSLRRLVSSELVFEMFSKFVSFRDDTILSSRLLLQSFSFNQESHRIYYRKWRKRSPVHAIVRHAEGEFSI